MIVRPYPIESLEIGVSRAPRSPGVHMSDIYNDLYQDHQPKKYRHGLKPNRLYFEFGLALEDIIQEGLRWRMCGERPGEFFTDNGIPYTPDGIDFQRNKTIVTEIKCTWMSCRECPISPEWAEKYGLESNWDGVSGASFPDKFDKYFTQIKVECYHLRTPYGRLIVYFVNGDGRPPRPVLLPWDFEFTAQELNDEWAWVRNHGISKGMIK